MAHIVCQLLARHRQISKIPVSEHIAK